jgi:membrane protease YdiL (CAAX protease family)
LRKDSSANNTADSPIPSEKRFLSTKFQVVGFFAVVISMVLLFISPSSRYFVYGVFVATPVMMVVAYWLTSYRRLFDPSVKSIAIGLISAAMLYLLFLGGNYAVQKLGNLIGLHAISEESSIYGSIGSHPLYLQLGILVFDALGFESYFRGTLQNFIVKRITNKKYRSGGVFLAAVCDSAIHILSLNPLWVVTTFIADSVWGLTFYKTKDLTSSVSSHLIWDIVIFIIAPIK